MKRILRKVTSVIFILWGTGSFNLYADNGIYLPDLTTVLEGSSEVYVPEIDMGLSEGIILPEGTDPLEVKMPEPEVTVEMPVIEEPATKPSENNVQINGELGGGWKNAYHGNIFLNTVGRNSFTMGMDYRAKDGDKIYSAFAGKIFQTENNKNFFYLNGSFRDAESKLVSESYNRTNSAISFQYRRILPKGFEISSNFSGDFYNRNFLPAENNLFIGLSPEVKGSCFFKDLQLSLTSNYQFERGLEENTHRGFSAFEAIWQNNYIMLLGTAGVVYGNSIGEQKCLFPFTVNTVFHFPVKFAEEEMYISLEGGLSSEKKSVSFLEQMCPYAVFKGGQTPLSLNSGREVTDWYGLFDFYMPIKSSFAINAGFEYRKSAYGNGFIQADYNLLPGEKGLYGFEKQNRQYISSTEGISYKSDNLNLIVSWTSFYDFVPNGIPEQCGFIYGNWILDAFELAGSLDLPVVSADRTPNLSLEASYKVNSSFRIALNVEDTVKLINRQSRPAYGQYESKSGSATLSVHFNF